MARIRTIKPEFWADEKMGRLPRDARLLFIGLLNFADDTGRLRGSPMLIRSQVFPYDPDIDSEKLLVTLTEASLIVRYEANGESLIWIRNFNKHQQIQHPSRSALPPPPPNSVRPQRVLNEDSLEEGNGREGKGKETTLSGERPTLPADRVFNFWRTCLDHEQAVFTPKRKKAVEARLKEGYSAERLINAIRGCSLDAFSMGENDRHTVFDDLELICRDGQHVEKFEALAPKQTGPPVRRKTDEEIAAEVRAEFEVKHGGV